jgi:hypothetical protein
MIWVARVVYLVLSYPDHGKLAAQPFPPFPPFQPTAKRLSTPCCVRATPSPHRERRARRHARDRGAARQLCPPGRVHEPPTNLQWCPLRKPERKAASNANLHSHQPFLLMPHVSCWEVHDSPPAVSPVALTGWPVGKCNDRAGVFVRLSAGQRLPRSRMDRREGLARSWQVHRARHTACPQSRRQQFAPYWMPLDGRRAHASRG